jgi:hypothetical protein
MKDSLKLRIAQALRVFGLTASVGLAQSGNVSKSGGDQQTEFLPHLPFTELTVEQQRKAMGLPDKFTGDQEKVLTEWISRVTQTAYWWTPDQPELLDNEKQIEIKAVRVQFLDAQHPGAVLLCKGLWVGVRPGKERALQKVAAETAARERVEGGKL